MPTRKSIKQSIADLLSPVLSIQIYTERQVEEPPAEFAVVHLSEREVLNEDFDGQLEYQAEMVIELFAMTDNRLEALEGQSKKTLRQAFEDRQLTELNSLKYNGDRFSDPEPGEPDTLIQSWTLQFED